MPNKLAVRPRRNRRNESIRNTVAETKLGLEHLVFPVFFENKPSSKTEIKSLPGLFRLGQKELLQEIEDCMKLGLRSFALFPKIEDHLKNSMASEAFNEKGLVPLLIKKIKKDFPDTVLYSDIALDPFSSDGHDGLVKDGKILNDETVEILCKMALVHAEAGADYVAPSDMMDGRVGAIRQALDESNYTETGILSYAAKYASAFYGPFREALDSAPRSGDKKTYQMDYRNRREALWEAKQDVIQGADIVMVKPALSYLDIIQTLRQKLPIPIAAYNVSGEYAMVKFAAKAGAIDGTQVMLESLTSIRRAGADMIFTYFAKEFATSQS